jgi:clan AA aspartic protease
MESETMGRVVVTARIENMEDLYAVRLGVKTPDQVRFVEVTDALVDTGASGLSLPARIIAQLGLERVRTQRMTTANGSRQAGVYGTAKLTIQGRVCPTDVLELADDCPVLIGQYPLEVMDWVVDLPGRQLIGNPAHNGELVYEVY